MLLRERHNCRTKFAGDGSNPFVKAMQFMPNYDPVRDICGPRISSKQLTGIENINIVTELLEKHGSLTTPQVGELLDKTVNSVFKTLRRMERMGLVRVRYIREPHSFKRINVYELWGE